MTRESRRKLTAMIVAGIVLIVLLMPSPHEALTVRDREGKVVLEIPVSHGETWSISYIHSWFRVPQEEIYGADTYGQMVLKEMRFGSYSAALYYNEAPPQGFTLDNGVWKICNINASLERLYFKVGYTTNCCLHIQGKDILFTSLASPGCSLEFRLQKLTWIDYFGRRLLDEFRTKS